MGKLEPPRIGDLGLGAHSETFYQAASKHYEFTRERLSTLRSRTERSRGLARTFLIRTSDLDTAVLLQESLESSERALERAEAKHLLMADSTSSSSAFEGGLLLTAFTSPEDQALERFEQHRMRIAAQVEDDCQQSLVRLSLAMEEALGLYEKALEIPAQLYRENIANLVSFRDEALQRLEQKLERVVQ